MDLSPLFRAASEELREAVRREFRASGLGRMLDDVREAIQLGPMITATMHNALDHYRRGGLRSSIERFKGMSFANFARDVERYARGGGQMDDAAKELLGELGPSGKLIRDVVAAGKPSAETDRLVKLLQAFGFEVLPPGGARGTALGQRGIRAAREYLEALGFTVAGPGEEPAKRTPPQTPAGGRRGSEGGQAYVELPMMGGAGRRFPPNHPIVTGDMLPAPHSSNVHSFGYDFEGAYLYVRFLGYIRGQRGVDGHAARGGPGSLYRYAQVPPDEFLTLMAASSKGEWVWDNLRIRGTWSGHRKDYELVGIEDGYVPRKATVFPNAVTGQLEEWFLKRRIRTERGLWLESQMAEECAGPMEWGRPDRGSPDRGRPEGPDRGTPDRGSP